MSGDEATERQDALRPYAQSAIQTEILNGIAGMIYSQIPYGEEAPFSFQVASQQVIIRRDTVPPGQPIQPWRLPWFSFTIFNDGPNPVYMAVNSEYPETNTPLNPGNFLSVDFKKKDSIKQVILNCTQGNVANVRIFAMR